MDDITYNRLMSKIDEQLSRLKVSHPVPSSVEFPHSTGFILTEDTKVDEIPEKQLPLIHSMLHMFYQNKSGRGLSQKTIERLHKDLIKKLPQHTKFDRLDKND